MACHVLVWLVLTCHDLSAAEDEATMTWEKQLAKKYHDKLFKEYCLVDLSRYKQGQYAMRWRVESEVFEGKGTQPRSHPSCL